MKEFQTSTRLHLALNVSDLEKSLQFYQILFEMQPTKLKSGYAKFEVVSPPLNLTLNQSQEVTGNHINHLGIQVKSSEAIKAQQERFQALGLQTRIEEQTICCYALQDKVWVDDPDGHAWEIFVVYEDSEYMHPPEATNQTCCVKEATPTALSCCA